MNSMFKIILRENQYIPNSKSPPRDRKVKIGTQNVEESESDDDEYDSEEESQTGD